MEQLYLTWDNQNCSSISIKDYVWFYTCRGFWTWLARVAIHRSCPKTFLSDFNNISVVLREKLVSSNKFTNLSVTGWGLIWWMKEVCLLKRIAPGSASELQVKELITSAWQEWTLWQSFWHLTMSSNNKAWAFLASLVAMAKCREDLLNSLLASVNLFLKLQSLKIIDSPLSYSSLIHSNSLCKPRRLPCTDNTELLKWSSLLP